MIFIGHTDTTHLNVRGATHHQSSIQHRQGIRWTNKIYSSPYTP